MKVSSLLLFSCIVFSGLTVLAIVLLPPAPSGPQAISTPSSGIKFAPFVFVDEETGCEYLSTHLSSALTPRLAADGKTHKGCAPTTIK